MGQWISRTFGSITLNVWQTDTTGNQTVYNVPSWPITTKVTNANKEQFRSTINAYLSYIADKDLTHQLYTNYNSGVSTTLSNGNSIEFQSHGLNVAYVTYEFDNTFTDAQYSLTGYLPYRRTDLDVGIKFRCIFSGTDPDNMSNGYMILRDSNSGVVSDYDIISSSIAIDDITFHHTSASMKAGAFDIPGYSGTTIGGGSIMTNTNPPVIMCEYLNGNKDRLMTSMEEPASSSDYLMPINGFYCWSTEGIDVTAEEPQEDGFMNEIKKRFSPRVKSNMLGMYIIPANTITGSPYDWDGIHEIADALVTLNLTDLATSIFTGSDAKENIVHIRWYYGLKDAIDDIASKGMYKISIGGGTLTSGAVGSDPKHSKYALTEFVEWKTSKLNVTPYFNNYLDYQCSYKLYIPYYGFLDIEPNDIVGGTIQLMYNINLSTGEATVLVACNNDRTNSLDTKYYTLNCKVGEEIPFGANIYKNMALAWGETSVKGAMVGASALTSMAGAYGGSLAAVNNANTSSSSSFTALTETAADMGFNPDLREKNIKYGRENALKNANINKQVGYLNMANDMLQNALPSVPNVHRSANVTDETGTMDELFPYLLITRPVNVEPADYEDYGGIPSSESVSLSLCNGFTQIAAVHPDSMATAPKYVNEIIALLQAGVYL